MITIFALLGTDIRITRPVLKPSDGFKAGSTALNPAGRLDIRLTPTIPADGFTTFLKPS